MALTHPAAPVIDVRQYGAACDGITDDSTAVNLAMAAAIANSYPLLFPSGFTTNSGRSTCKIGSQVAAVLSSTQSLWIRGEGRDITTILVPSSFSLASTGVFSITTGGGLYTDSGGIEDLTIKFSQPDTAITGDKIQYPPAIYTTGTNHFKIRRVNIACAWDGINVGVVNGISIDDCAMSQYHTALTINESYDGASIKQVLLWPVGMTGNQATAWGISSTNGFLIGRVDAIQIDGCTLSTGVKSMDFHVGSLTNLGSKGTISNCWFDATGNVVVSAGALTFTNIDMSFAAATDSSATSGFHVVGGARVTVANSRIVVATAVAPVFRFLPTSDTNLAGGSGRTGLKVVNTEIFGATYDNYTFLIQSTSPASKASRVTLQNVTIEKDPTVAYANPMIGLLAPTGGTCRLRVSGLDITDLTSGSGVAMNIAADDYHNIDDSSTFTGWTVVVPSTIAKARFPSLPGLVYATVASATSITPSGPLFNISGTTTITTITAPTGFQYQRIRITKIDAGSATIGGGGNIPGSHTLAQYGSLDLTWDGTRWL